MNVTVRIPDDLAAAAGGDIEVRALEVLALAECRADAGHRHGQCQWHIDQRIGRPRTRGSVPHHHPGNQPNGTLSNAAKAAAPKLSRSAASTRGVVADCHTSVRPGSHRRTTSAANGSTRSAISEGWREAWQRRLSHHSAATARPASRASIKARTRGSNSRPYWMASTNGSKPRIRNAVMPMS